MNKKPIFGLFVSLIFMASAALYFAGFVFLNARRHNLAEFYASEASHTSDTTKKLVLLTKSDALLAKDDRKVQIALLYFDLNKPQKAEYYLKLSNDRAANIYLAEYCLLNNTSNAKKYLDRIPDGPEKRELLAFSDLAEGKTTSPLSINTPQTDLGRLLFAINTQDYSQIKNAPLLKMVNQVVTKSSNSNNQTLTLADYFMSSDKSNFSLFIINSLPKNSGETNPALTLKAKAYAKLGDFKAAENQIKRAILIAPEDVTLYQAGIDYAKKTNDTAMLEYWQARASELATFQK